jgi:hypothetical protein
LSLWDFPNAGVKENIFTEILPLDKSVFAFRIDEGDFP